MHDICGKFETFYSLLFPFYSMCVNFVRAFITSTLHIVDEKSWRERPTLGARSPLWGGSDVLQVFTYRQRKENEGDENKG